jgi:acetyl-CoA carboxylase carboxyl transferase subunit alpha
LKPTAQDIIKLGVIDEIIKEPVGGAHRDHGATAKNVKEAIARNLAELNKLSADELVEGRYNKFRAMSRFVE